MVVKSERRLTGFDLNTLSVTGQDVIFHVSRCTSCRNRVDFASKVLLTLDYRSPSSNNPANVIDFVKHIQMTMFEPNDPLHNHDILEFVKVLQSYSSCKWIINHLRTMRRSSNPDSCRLYAEDMNCDSNCSICLDDFKTWNFVSRTSCGHSFHTNCLDNWLKDNESCPLCRTALAPKFAFCRGKP